jgi:hypothetical protein
LFSLLTVAFATVLMAVPVAANAPGDGTGNLDPFQPIGAVPDCPPGTVNLNNPTTDADDVPVTCVPVGSDLTQQVTVTWVSDTVSGNQTDDAWGQGDKSDCFLAKRGGVSGACVTQVFGIGASKTDLQYHGIGLETGTNDHDYFYSGIKRLQAGGVTSSNANYNVEINQLLPAYEPADPICPLEDDTGGCNMWRSPGDLTFMTDWGGNQSSCGVPTPAICGYVWIDFSTGTGKTPSEAGSTCFNAQTAPCWGLPPGGSAALSANPDKAAGSINSNAAIQPFTFSEIGVDLTESGLVDEGDCLTFHNVWAHSRSSSSFSAELKDFIFGAVELDTCSSTSTVLQERSGADTVPPTATDVGSPGKVLTVVLGAWVRDTASVVPSSATGDIKFKLYAGAPTTPPLTAQAQCEADDAGTNTGAGITTVSTNALSSGSATSSTVQFNTVGDFYWRAFYSGSFSDSASECDEIVHVVQVATDIRTAPWVYPNDKVTLSAPNGGGTMAGSISFKLYDTSANCTAGGATGLLYTEAPPVTVTGAGDYNTSNVSVKVSTDTTVFWRVEFTSTNPAQAGRNSLCQESILTDVTGDSTGGTAPTP